MIGHLEKRRWLAALFAFVLFAAQCAELRAVQSSELSLQDQESDDTEEWLETDEEYETGSQESDEPEAAEWTPPRVSVVPVPETVTNESVVDDAGNFPWYDAKQKSLHPTAVSEEPIAPKPWNWTWDWDLSGAGGMGWAAIWSVVQVIVWLGLICLFGWMIVAWLRYLARQDYKVSPANLERERQRHEIDSIEQLPFQMAKPQTDLLSEARRQYQQGNYREAIIYLFSYQLIQLDRHQKIRLAKGKTNRQYLFELRQQASLRDILGMSTHLFEDVFFGHYDLDRQRFEQVWTRLDEFDRLAQQEAP